MYGNPHYVSNNLFAAILRGFILPRMDHLVDCAACARLAPSMLVYLGRLQTKKMPFNRCFIHGPIAFRASNLAK